MIPLGKALPLTATERQHGLMKIVSDYCRVIRQAVRGDYRDPVRHPATRRADQGAVIELVRIRLWWHIFSSSVAPHRSAMRILSDPLYSNARRS